MNELQTKSSSFTAVPVFLAFLCMGFGDAIGPFVGLAKDEFELTPSVAMLIPFIGFLMFGLLSIPIGVLQDRKGKRFILLLGLLIALIGLVIPSFGLSSFELFLLTILLLGAGSAILQVAGNPIMRDVSPEGKYARNLSFGQFIKAIGSLSGPLIPLAAARWFGMDWSVIFPIYSIFIAATIIVIGMTRIKERKYSDAKPTTFASAFSLLNNKFVLFMVLSIFMYVGAEVCMSSGLPLYLDKQFGIDIQTLGVAGSGFFFVALMTGRFLGTVILNWISAKHFLVITAIISIVGILGLFIQSQTIALISIFVIGLGFANVFPLVFSIAVDSMPERTNDLAGLMITAIVGGAFIPLLMGGVAKYVGIVAGFLVPILCFVFILSVAVYATRKVK